MDGRVFVKFCGLRTVEDFHCAAECDVDYCGLMLYQQSPRYIECEEACKVLESARTLAAKPLPKLVGVFVDAGYHEMERCISLLKLDAVQVYTSWGGAELSAPYWYALRVQNREWLNKLVQLDARRTELSAEERSTLERELKLDAAQYLAANTLLLDSYKVGVHGGTGQRFDWSWLEHCTLHAPYLVAGGITVDTISQLLSYHPWGIDVSSGIEKERGVKDHKLMRMMMQRVRENRAL